MINLTVYTAVTCTYGSRKPTDFYLFSLLLILLNPIEKRAVQPIRHEAKLLQLFYQEEKILKEFREGALRSEPPSKQLFRQDGIRATDLKFISSYSPPPLPELTEEEIRRFAETGSPSPPNELNFSLTSRGGETQNSLASSITKAHSFNKKLFVLQNTLISSEQAERFLAQAVTMGDSIDI